MPPHPEPRKQQDSKVKHRIRALTLVQQWLDSCDEHWQVAERVTDSFVDPVLSWVSRGMNATMDSYGSHILSDLSTLDTHICFVSRVAWMGCCEFITFVYSIHANRIFQNE